jgi:hypothetical protein
MLKIVTTRGHMHHRPLIAIHNVWNIHYIAIKADSFTGRDDPHEKDIGAKGPMVERWLVEMEYNLAGIRNLPAH